MEKLSALKAELQAVYPTLECHYYAVNLAEEGERKALMDWIVSEKYNLSLLANVAGVDIQKGVETYTQEKVSLQCRVNLEAAVDLCRFAVQHRGKALEIINVSSVSGIYPMPYFAIYSATKSALTSFSISLREEMKGQNVSVTVVLPGAMPTRADIRKQIEGQGLWGKLAVMSPEAVASKALKAVQLPHIAKPRVRLGKADTGFGRYATHPPVGESGLRFFSYNRRKRHRRS